MTLTGTQLREQMISFGLQTVDAQEREIAELKKQVTDLQQQLAQAQTANQAKTPKV